MKFNKSGQLLLIAAASMGVAGLISACGTLTVDFVFVTSAKAAGPNNYGEIDVFEVNSESGRMKQIPTSPFPSGGRNPVAEAVSTDQTNLYVVNEDDNTIVQFVIGNDGKVYPQNTVNTPGAFPVAVAVQGKNLFVADTYQPLPICSPASPCSGSVAMYPIKSDDSLLSPVVNPAVSAAYWPLALPSSPKDVITPTAITVDPSGSTLYVAAYDTTAGGGYIFAFSASGGTLSPVNGGVPVAAGAQPSSITCDPTGSYLYVTDLARSNVLGFSIAAGAMTPLSGSPFAAGSKPSAILIEKKGQFAYVTNSLDSTIEAYSISNGNLSYANGSSNPVTFAVDAQPVAIGIDPSLNEYLYTANFLGNTVSGFQIDLTNGTLLSSQFSPFPSNANPTAMAAVTHGAVAKQ